MHETFKIELDVAAQIPNPTEGADATICSNCGSEQLETNRCCSSCYLHFIGPIGFPPVDEWEKLTPEEKIQLVNEVRREKSNFGKVQLYAQLNGIEIRVSFH